MSKIKGKLGGYKKSKVDEYFKQIKHSQAEELDELAKKIETCRREKELLKEELSSLTDQDSCFESLTILELALNKVENVINYINQKSEEDVETIRKSASQKLLALEDSIAVLDEAITEAKEKIENGLKNIIKTTDLSGINSSDKKNIGKVYPIADWLKNNKTEPSNNISNNEKEFWEEEHPESLPQELKQMTADGATEVPLLKTNKSGDNLADTSIKQSNQDDEPIPDKSNQDYVPIPEESNQDYEPISDRIDDSLDKENEDNYFTNSQDDYWAADDGEKEIDPSIAEIAVTIDLKEKPDMSDNALHKESQEVDNSGDFYISEEYSDLESDFEGNKDQSERSDGSEYVPTQVGVRKEIDNVRHKYVLGKIAGEDLLDDAGQVIILKNGKITERVLEIAQKEGKLADLIIHMILPGQEE